MVLFTGSSSIRLWTDLEKYFPGTPVLNRGFGGSHMEHLVHYADRVIIPYRPRMVFVYEGDNDINAGKTPEAVFEGFESLTGIIREKLPATRIAFIAIKPSPSRWALVEKIKQANLLIRDYAATDKRLIYIDVFSPMLDQAGQGRSFTAKTGCI
jgi:hypothetical protein